MAEKQTSKDRMREIVDSIENGIKELFESDKYRQYLSTMSRFHRYSVNNTMLIYMQRPDATHVAGFNKWRDQFGRNVLKGEKDVYKRQPLRLYRRKLSPNQRNKTKREKRIESIHSFPYLHHMNEEAVSYTHLDVYKRQVPVCIIYSMHNMRRYPP